MEYGEAADIPASVTNTSLRHFGPHEATSHQFSTVKREVIGQLIH